MRYFIIAVLGLAFSLGTAAAQQHDRPQVSIPSDADVYFTRSIGVAFDSTENGIVISEVYLHMPAYSAGLCKGDRLLAINHKPVTSMSAAQRLTQNIAAPSIMVDFQRRDMRVCRRVNVADGRPQHVGSFKDGRSVAFAIGQFANGTSEQFMDVASTYSPNDIDTIILDMRETAGGVSDEAQKIARMLSGSRSYDAQDVKVIVLQSPMASEVAREMADLLVKQRDAEVWGVARNASIINDASGIRAVGLYQARRAVAMPAYTHLSTAPVQWNMAAFRKLYPQPERNAAAHQMLALNSGVAPLAWGINGNAWTALETVRKRY